MWNRRQQEGRNGGLRPDGTCGEALSVFYPLFCENILLSFIVLIVDDGVYFFCCS